MKKITDVSELRLIQMEILSYVDKVCRDNNIRYSLAGGTLIGAVRHKGFIPWDDDIDIMLVREEYEKLIGILSINDNNENTPYKVLTHSKERGYLYPFAKVIDDRTVLKEKVRGGKDFGIDIDVFPIDNIPCDENRTNIILKKMRLLYNILTIKRLKLSCDRSSWKNLTIIASRILLLPVSYHWIINRMERKALSYSEISPCRRACLVWGYGQKEVVPYSIHESHIELPFENRHYMAIADYHTYLTNVYGNYMQLPPEEKRISHHDFEAYWK